MAEMLIAIHKCCDAGVDYEYYNVAKAAIVNSASVRVITILGLEPSYINLAEPITIQNVEG